jgi:hypothetical protein
VLQLQPTFKLVVYWWWNIGYYTISWRASSTDGVVLTTMLLDQQVQPFPFGRTATQVGHWMNLRHIWGDATCGSDLVSDTPTHNAANSGFQYPTTVLVLVQLK